MQNLSMNPTSVSNLIKIKAQINEKFRRAGLPHRLYTTIHKGGGWYQLPLVQVNINLMTEDRDYYTLDSFILNSNQCQLLTEKDLLEMVIKHTHPSILIKDRSISVNC